MPPPKKLDLIPDEFRQWLKEELQSRGFAQIVEVTEALNFRLDDAGLEVRVGKTSVGEFSKLLKDQRDAFSIAETLLADMDVQAEGDLHKTLLQMIATSAMQMIRAVREDDGHLDAKDLMSLGRMLKDLMQSSGMREKFLEDDRIRTEARTKAKVAKDLDASSLELGLSADTVEAIKKKVLGVS